jgi:hypothetical protein
MQFFEAKYQEALLSTNHPSSFAVILVLLSTVTLNASNAYGDTNDTLDVNLNSIYIRTRTQSNFDALSEIILQIPYPISETAKKTGAGPFGGITYFDDKILASSYTQRATVLGLGRIYYSATVPGDTPVTFVPYLTFYRALSFNHIDPLGPTAESKTNAWLPPGFMYAYRYDRKVALHLDMDLYSYSQMRNNRARMGFSYTPRWPIIFSMSYERVSWDLNGNVNGNNSFMRGDTSEYSAKVIVRDPPNGNFSLIVGYSNFRNAAFLEPNINSWGRFFGIEASAGVLAW